MGSNFNIDQFDHKVIINHTENRVELFLEVLEKVTITWPGNSRVLNKGDLIHTENSHKYTVKSISELLKNAGFGKIQIWTDPKDYFAVVHAQ